MLRTILAATLTLALAVAAFVPLAPARPAEEGGISFRQRADDQKKFYEKVGTAVIKAAHATAKKIAMQDHKLETPKANRTELKIKMEYFGAVTNKKYLADVLIKVDTTDKNAWEVLSVDYTDNNTVGANLKKIQGLVKEMNK